MTRNEQERIASIRYRINQNIENELAKLGPSEWPRPPAQIWQFIKTVHTMNSFLWRKLEA